MSVFNGVSLEELQNDPPEHSKEQVIQILLKNRDATRESLKAVSASNTTINNLGGTILTVISPVNCIIGRSRDRKSYPSPYWVKKRITVSIRGFKGKELEKGLKSTNEVVQIRVVQFIPNPKYSQ